MADEQIVTSIVAKADLSSLVSEVHRASASLQQLQRELLASNRAISSSTKLANNLFRDTLTGSGQFSSHFVNLNSDVDKFGKNLDSGRLKLKNYFQTFREHATTQKGMIRELAKEQVMLQNSVLQPLGRNAQGLMQYNVMIPRGLDAIANSGKLARMEMQIMNRALSEGAGSLINWGKNTQWAGRQLTVGLTVPMTMFGAAAGKAFKEADQELVRLTKVYGGLAATSASDLKAIREEVVETAKVLSKTMGASFKDTIALGADIAATGQTGNQLLGSIEETTRLAILGEVDRQDAMKATLSIQTAFKQNTKELTESINFLNAVENQTSTTLNDLVEAIPKAGPVIQQLGGDVKDLALYLTAMREGGISASEGANALKSGLASLINPTKQTVGIMSDFGIDVMGMVAKNTGDTTGLLMDLQKALDSLDPLSKARAMEQMFGKFQFARMSALLNNLGKQGSQTLQVLDLMKASTGDLASIASRELKMVTESASGKYKRAIEGLKAELADVGEEFLGVATKLISAATKILDFFTKMPDPIKKALTFLAGFTALVGPLIMLTGLLANFFGYITKGVVQLRAFFQKASGWKMLTPEIIAAEKAALMVENAFYSDAAAAQVLHNALQKLVLDYQNLQAASMKNAVPVNGGVSTVAGNPVMVGGRRVVDPDDPYVGDPNTRAMSHIRPRDINNPATIFGGVPGAIPVNRGISRTPQMYMHDRLPNIEGLTSVKGISTGIVSGEAAKFHALMATLGMQTEQEVATLKKTIAMGGTVSRELLDTFDDILPITQRFADSAATQSALIVQQMRNAEITVDQAKARILALNAQIETDMGSAVSLYAASRGRSIDLTRAPMMDQPVVDANGQFTLRDLYKKKTNAVVMEEFGRLRGVRTFGAPYSIQTTRMPKFNDGGGIESFGPGKTMVSGPSSVNYDDRLGSVPVGGYVLNQSASMDPANAPLVEMAAATYEDGGEITAALTPREVVFGPKIQRMPELYNAVEAANNGYNFGGQVIRGIGNYGLWDDYKSKYAILERYDSSENWMEESKFRMKMAAAAALVDIGLDPKLAVRYAHDDVEKAFNDSMTKSGRVDRAKFKNNARIISTKRHRVVQKLTGKNLIGVGPGQVALHAGAVAKNPSAAISLLNELLSNPEVMSRVGMDEADRIFKRLLGITARHLQMTPDNMLAGLLGDKKYNKIVMEHVSPRDIARSKGRWGYDARGHYLQAFAGEDDINKMHNVLGDTKNKKLWGNFVALDDKHAKSLVEWGLKTQKEESMPAYKSSISRGAVGNSKFNLFKSLVLGTMPIGRGLSLAPRMSFVDARGNTGGIIAGGRIVPTRKNYGNISPAIKLLAPDKQLKILAKAKELSSKGSLGKFADMPVTEYGHQISASSGMSYPIPGVSGLYKNAKGKKVFVKGVPNELTAVHEPIGTLIARDLFGIHSPEQRVVTVGNPVDPTKKSKLLALESDFDPRFANTNVPWDEDTLIRQHANALLLNNKDLSRGNVYGNFNPDVGQAGVLPKASGNTALADQMNSMETQALINLLAVRGGARKDFARDTAPIVAKMNPKKYGRMMKKTLEKARPKLVKIINDLPEDLKPPYIQMLERLDAGIAVDWSKYHAIHANPKYLNSGGPVGGGPVKRNRSAYGRPGNPAKRAAWEAEQRAQRERDAAAARSRASSHQITGQQSLTTGLGREAVRTGTTSFYNPGQVMVNNMMDPFKNSAAMKAQYLSAVFSSMATSAVRGATTLRYALMTSGTHTVQAYKESAMNIMNSTKAVSTKIISSARASALKIQSSGSRFYNAIVREQNAFAAKHYPAAQAPQQGFFGPGIIGRYKDLGDGLQSRKVGSLGFRRTEYLVDGVNMTAKQAKAAGIAIPQRANGMSMGAQMGIGMAGSMGGMALMGKEKVNILGKEMSGMTAGMSLMAATSIIPMLPLGRMLTSVKAGATSAKLAISKFSMTMNGLKSGIALLARFAKGFGPIGVAISVATAGFKIYKAIQNDWQDARMGLSMTAKAAEQAGVKYFNLQETMQGYLDKQQAVAVAGKAGQYSSIGMPGLPKSIEDMKKVKEEGKALKEVIESINRSQSTEETKRLLSTQKAQYIASGMSVEEANRKLYGALLNSEKALQAYDILGNSAFGKIVDKATAAEYAVGNLINTLNKGSGTADWYKEVGVGFEGLINTFQSATDGLVGTKDEMGNVIDEYKAYQMVMSSSEKMFPAINEEIGLAALNNLSKTQPLLAGIANEADSIKGILAKWTLFTKGINIDLSKIDTTLAIKLAGFTEAIGTGITQLTTSKDMSTTFGAVGTVLEKLKKSIASVSAASQRSAAAAQRSAQEELKLIAKKIKLIDDEKNKKLEALRATQDASNYALELQKLQIEYSDAVSRGDMAAANRAQLEIDQLTMNRQAQLTQQAIEDAAAKQKAPLEKDAAAIQDKSDRDNVNNQIARDNAASASEIATTITDFQKTYNELIQRGIVAKLMPDPERKVEEQKIQQALLNLVKEVQTSGTGNSALAKSIREAFQKLNLFDKNGNPIPISTTPAKTSGYPTIGPDGKIVTPNPVINQDILTQFGRDIAAVAGIASEITQGTSLDRLRLELKAALGLLAPDKRKLSFDSNTNKTQIFDGTKLNVVKSPTGNSFYVPVKDFEKAGMGYLPETIFTDKNGTRWVTKQTLQGKVYVYKMADGGKISGPGTGTSDSIPAMLSHGEYVVKASSVAKYGVDTLDAINAQKFHKGGPVHAHLPDGTHPPSQISLGNNRSLPVYPTGTVWKPGMKGLSAWDSVWNNQFYTPPTKNYGIDKIKSPMGSLRRFLEIARSQVGKGHDYVIHDENSPKGRLADPLSGRGDFDGTGVNKFTLWSNKKHKIGKDVAWWCGQFVAWVAEQSGVEISSKMFSAYQATQQYKKQGLFNDLTKESNLKNLKVGDLAWFDYATDGENGAPAPRDSVPDHASIVSKVGKNISVIGWFGDDEVREKVIRDRKDLFGSVSPEFNKPTPKIINDPESLSPATAPSQSSDTSTALSAVPTGFADGGIVALPRLKKKIFESFPKKPGKTRTPGGMGIDKDPDRYAGSGASMGGIGNGAYGFGPLMLANGGMVQKFGFGGFVKSLFKKSPKFAASGATWQGMEEIEKALSLKWGANQNASGLSKWTRALGRVAFNTAQGTLAGASSAGGLGLLPGLAAGLVEGVYGIAKDGSQYGVKGGTQSSVKGFNAKDQLASMSLKNSGMNIAKTAASSALAGPALEKLLKVAKNVAKPVSKVAFAKGDEIWEQAKNTLPLLKGFNPFAEFSTKEVPMRTTPLPIFDQNLLFPKFTNNLIHRGILPPTQSQSYYESVIRNVNDVARLAPMGRDSLGLPSNPSIISSGGKDRLVIGTPNQLSVNNYRQNEVSQEPESFLSALKRSIIKNKKPTQTGSTSAGSRDGESRLADSSLKYKRPAVPNQRKYQVNSVPIKLWMMHQRKQAQAYWDTQGDNAAFAQSGSVFMPDIKLRTEKNALGEWHTARHPHADDETLIHEFGHRDLDLFGNISNILQSGPKRFNTSSTHEIYADAFAHNVIKKLRGSGLSQYENFVSRADQGLGYNLRFPSSGVGSPGFRRALGQNLTRIIELGLTTRPYQVNSGWMLTHSQLTRKWLGKEGANQADMYGVIGRLLKANGIDNPKADNYDQLLWAFAKKYRLKINVQQGTPGSTLKPKSGLQTLLSMYPEISASIPVGLGIGSASLSNARFNSNGNANGGFANIPKFENGINMVPADMLALLHKNEAVVPANMNPFNPNASAAVSGSVYNINVELNGTTVTAKDVALEIRNEMRIKEMTAGVNRTVGKP